MQNHTIKFFDYHTWATNKLFDHLETLPMETINEEAASSFSTIKETLLHLFVVEKGGLSMLKREAFQDIKEMTEHINGLTALAQSKDREGLRELFNDLHKDYGEFLRGIEDLDEVVPMLFGPSSYTDMMIHFVNHGTYHRGNITTMLRQLGHSGCNTDYGVYVYEKNNY